MEPMTPPVPEKIRLKHRVEYAVVKFFKERAGRASEKTLKHYQSLLFALLYLFRVSHKVVQTNLNIAFPELTKKARAKLLLSNYQWTAKVAVEILHLDFWKGKTAEYVNFHNVSALDEALLEQKGVLLISGHFGHWQMIGPALVEKGYRVHVYMGKQSNPLVDKLHNENQQSFGVQTIRKGTAARFEFMRILKNENILAMSVDQNDHKSDTFVNFFGKLATLPKSVAGFHLLKKSPIVLAFCPFIGGKPEIFFQRLHCPLTGNKAQDQFAITQEISHMTEAFVRKYPEQYFWMHRRWRTRPPGEAETIY